jgi:YebC/PmpR family DNA-binding regulatory protein
MSGHSKWSTIKRKKAKVDQARGRLFSRLTREIIAAAREGGGDPSANARLRMAVDNARLNNLPGENIERAIRRGTGDLPGVDYESVWYEGYAPGGVAILVETLTDNRNRTVSEIRHIFTKRGGSLAETGSVSWQFEAKGTLFVEGEGVDEDALMMTVLEAGGEDLTREGEAWYVVTPVEAFEAVKSALEQADFPYRDAQIARVPKNLLTLPPPSRSRPSACWKRSKSRTTCRTSIPTSISMTRWPTGWTRPERHDGGGPHPRARSRLPDHRLGTDRDAGERSDRA